MSAVTPADRNSWLNLNQDAELRDILSRTGDFSQYANLGDIFGGTRNLRQRPNLGDPDFSHYAQLPADSNLEMPWVVFSSPLSCPHRVIVTYTSASSIDAR